MEGRGRRTPPGPPGVAFVGREAELAILEGILDKARGGTTHFVVVEGEAGMGKSRLLDEFVAHPVAAGSFLYRARAEELQPRPFGLVADALGIAASSPDPDRRGIADLLDASGDEEATDSRYRVIEGVLDLIERQAIAGPVLVVVDDVHWADPSSAQALHVVSRRLAYLPVLVLMACRPLPRAPELARLVDNLAEVGGHHLKLEPLAEAAVSELAASRLGADPGPVLRDRLNGAAGNPLFLLELLDALSEEGVIELQGGVAEATTAVEPPPSLRMTVVRRLAFLDPASLDLLRTASVLGGSFSAAQLSVVTGKPLLEVLSTLEEPVASGFVTASGESFAFRHDVVREALYLELPPAVRKGLHLHVGRALAAAGSPPAEVAPHLALGAEFGDREAVDCLRRAARELRSRAPGMAVQLLERASSLLPAEDPDRASLVQEEMRTLALVGRVREAEALAENVLARMTDPRNALELAVDQVQVLILQSRFQEAKDLSERLLESASLPMEIRAELLANTAAVRIVLGDIDGALAVVAELRPFTDAHPRSPATTWSLVTEGYVDWATGFVERSLEIIGQAVASSADSPHRGAQALLFLGWGQLVGDRLDEARATLHRVRTQLEHFGYLTLMPEYHAILACLHFLAGQWDDALAEMATARQLTEETGARGVRFVWVSDPSPLIHLHRGDVPAARDALATVEGEPTFRACGVAGTLWMEPMRALVQEGAGEPEAALRTFEAWRKTVLRATLLPDYRGSARTLVRVSRAHGKAESLDQVAEEAVEATRRARSVASVEGTALLVRGMIEGDPEALLAAVEAFRASPRLFDRAEACAEAAVTLLTRGRDGEGRALVDEAFDLYDELGASRPEAALAGEVRAFGIRRGARGRRQRAVSGWSALTTTEERIVALVSEGLTNAEIGERLYISRGTVATHLRSVFRKLDVSSRAELAAGAARRLS